jgi:hypothetical protein
LDAFGQGNAPAAAHLVPLLYDELRRLAAAQLAHENPGQTLDATALVHEAYLRLCGDQRFENRRHIDNGGNQSRRGLFAPIDTPFLPC